LWGLFLLVLLTKQIEMLRWYRAIGRMSFL